MIRPNFLTTADRLELLSCVKRQREDHGVARRANALLLLDTGMSCVQIAKVLFLDDDTVRSWHKQYLAEDWEAVAYDGWKGGQSRMTTAQVGNLSAWLEERFCRSSRLSKKTQLWLGSQRVKSSHSHDIRPRPREHSRRSEPGNLRRALC